MIPLLKGTRTIPNRMYEFLFYYSMHCKYCPTCYFIANDFQYVPYCGGYIRCEIVDDSKGRAFAIIEIKALPLVSNMDVSPSVCAEVL